MTLKALLLVSFSCLLFASQDIPIEKIVGTYGKDGVEFVCLQLFDNYRFDMTISSCSKDESLNGAYRIENDQVFLTTDDQPQMALKNERPGPEKQNGLQLSANDPLLLKNLTLAINHQKRMYRPTGSGFVAFEGDIRHVQVMYPELKTVSLDIVSPSPSVTVDLIFSHLSIPTLKDQPWTFAKRQLTHTTETGETITLRRVKKCWFD